MPTARGRCVRCRRRCYVISRDDELGRLFVGASLVQCLDNVETFRSVSHRRRGHLAILQESACIVLVSDRPEGRGEGGTEWGHPVSNASGRTVEEIDFSADVADFGRLKPAEQHFILTVLSFFAASDGIVNLNIAQRLVTQIQLPEIVAFYNCQILMETIHSEAYSLMIEVFCSAVPSINKHALFEGMDRSPSINAKAKWFLDTIDSEPVGEAAFPTRLITMACVEGIFFSSSFASIFYMRKRGLLPGLCMANNYISRDEGLHMQFAVLLFRKLGRPLPSARVLEIVREATALELEFVAEALPVEIIGMNAPLMEQYVKYVANYLCTCLECDKAYPGVTNPFDWMEAISLEKKANFFEKVETEYALSGVMEGADHPGTATIGSISDMMTADF